MLVGVNSLEEAIEYVKDEEVREELRYQYEYHIKPRLEEAEKADAYKERVDELEAELEDMGMTIDNYEDENDSLSLRVEELEAQVEELEKQRA